MTLIRKTFPLFILLTALFLSACAGLTPPPVQTPAQSATAGGAPTAVSQAALPTAILQATLPTALEAATGTPAKAECRVDTSSQTDPSLASRYPKVGSADWTQGPETAFVNILEYSDFQ